MSDAEPSKCNVDPVAWARWHPAAEECHVGDAQSPIDVVRGVATDGEPASVVLDYRPVRANEILLGHTLRVELEPGCRMLLDGVEHELVEFHFHTPSEHTLDDQRFALEIHLVHRSAAGDVAVLGVLARTGTPHPELERVLRRRPDQPGAEEHLDRPLDPTALLPDEPTFYRYDGSLTTPPLSEGVRWIVLESPIETSPTQLHALADLFPDTARPRQPRNDRPLLRGTL